MVLTIHFTTLVKPHYLFFALVNLSIDGSTLVFMSEVSPHHHVKLFPSSTVLFFIVLEVSKTMDNINWKAQLLNQFNGIRPQLYPPPLPLFLKL